MKGRMELDRDEELSFFRELRKKQNEHFPSLLLSASEDYERDPNGGSGMYAIATYSYIIHHIVILLNISENLMRIKIFIAGKFSLYKIPSGRKEFGLEFLETNKSEFDW